MRPIITLTTDFGEGTYVAQMKGVLLAACPDARIVDIAHHVAPQSVAEGASLLLEAATHFPPKTIHVAVIDPGVGTQRALLYAEIGAWRFLAPDNGLLQKCAEKFPLHRIIRLDNKSHWRNPVSATFHGRDILCPVAAYLANGGDPDELGCPVSSMVTMESPKIEVRGERLTGLIERIDHFGNLITNIPSLDFSSFEGDIVKIVLWNGRFSIPFRRTYGQLSAGRIVGLIGSSNWFEIAVVQGNAQKTLRSKLGDGIVVQLPLQIG